MGRLLLTDKISRNENVQETFYSYGSITDEGRISLFPFKSRDLSFTVTPSRPKKGAAL